LWESFAVLIAGECTIVHERLAGGRSNGELQDKEFANIGMMKHKNSDRIRLIGKFHYQALAG
jgi:hypothetical protein